MDEKALKSHLFLVTNIKIFRVGGGASARPAGILKVKGEGGGEWSKYTIYTLSDDILGHAQCPGFFKMFLFYVP